MSHLVRFDQHLINNLIDNRYGWVILPEAPDGHYYVADDRAAYVHNGSIRWGADGHQYNLGGLTESGLEAVAALRTVNPVELWSNDNGKSWRYQLSWDAPVRNEDANDAKFKIFDALAKVYRGLDIGPSTGPRS